VPTLSGERKGTLMPQWKTRTARWEIVVSCGRKGAERTHPERLRTTLRCKRRGVHGVLEVAEGAERERRGEKYDLFIPGKAKRGGTTPLILILLRFFSSRA